MKCVPCFLTLLSFLLALGTGCSASQPAKPTAPDKALAKPKPKPPPVVEAEVSDERHGVILSSPNPKAKTVDMFCTCLATGEFDLAPSEDQLVMETWCVCRDDNGDRHPFQIEDTLSRHAMTKKMADVEVSEFGIPFNDAVVKLVLKKGEDPIVKICYKDENQQDAETVLEARTGTNYRYSFDELVPDTIWPHAAQGMAPVEVGYAEEGESSS